MPAIKFRGVDFLEFDSLLNEDELLVRNTARQFIEDNLIPIIEECNRAGRFPRELVKPMADLGFFGAVVKGYGCAGCRMWSMGWSCRRWSAATPACGRLSACSRRW